VSVAGCGEIKVVHPDSFPTHVAKEMEIGSVGLDFGQELRRVASERNSPKPCAGLPGLARVSTCSNGCSSPVVPVESGAHLFANGDT
jgi:hypothetical protein